MPQTMFSVRVTAVCAEKLTVFTASLLAHMDNYNLTRFS